MEGTCCRAEGRATARWAAAGWHPIRRVIYRQSRKAHAPFCHRSQDLSANFMALTGARGRSWDVPVSSRCRITRSRRVGAVGDHQSGTGILRPLVHDIKWRRASPAGTNHDAAATAAANPRTVTPNRILSAPTPAPGADINWRRREGDLICHDRGDIAPVAASRRQRGHSDREDSSQSQEGRTLDAHVTLSFTCLRAREQTPRLS